MGDEWTTVPLQKDTVRMLRRLRDETGLEAWASGLPIIGTDVGGSGRFVNEGETDELIPLIPPTELADPISELFPQPDRIQQMGQRSYESIAEGYTWDRIVEWTHKLYFHNVMPVRFREQLSPTEAFTPWRLSEVEY